MFSCCPAQWVESARARAVPLLGQSSLLVYTEVLLKYFCATRRRVAYDSTPVQHAVICAVVG